MMVRAQLAWYCLSPTGRGSDFSPEAFVVVYAEERRCTGPASDILLMALSKGIFDAHPVAFAASLVKRPGASEARELSDPGLKAPSVLRRSISSKFAAK